jgi:hypothetical protein
MDPRILRGCRRSLDMWREAIGRYRQPQQNKAERVKSQRLKRIGLPRLFDRDDRRGK